jgi:pyruvate/2-oxoglutarate dehydrogenase complex dihydrolipoamide acyltransferase (E2) component
MNTKTEINTINTSELVFNFIQQIEMVDVHELARFEAQEKSVGFLRLLRNQYSTIQHGNAKQIKAGELPHIIALEAVTRLWESKDRNGDFINFKEYQMKQLKYYIETGEIYTRKREVLQEKAAVNIDKLAKKAAAEAKAAEAAKAKAAKAAEAKAKAEAKAVEAKAKADALLAEAQEAADAMNENGGVEEFLTLADAQEAAEAEAEAEAAEAKAEAEAEVKAKAEAKAAEAKAAEAKAKVAEARLKAEALARGKASNNKTEPSLNFKTTNFSQDCKDTASMILKELERDASAPELLYLAKLILDKYNK